MNTTSVSLLERLRVQPDDASWQRFDALYRPLIQSWIRRDPNLRNDAEDLTQEVLAVVVRELAGFERQRVGSLRAWLRTITCNRVKAAWQTRKRLPQLVGGDGQDSVLAQLEDPASPLSKQWDEEHDRHVVRRLLELIEGDFEPTTLIAFRRVVFDKVKPAAVAAELGISENAVLIAKFRVVKRLRQEAEGLLD